jgi:hypothetical protein
MRILLICARPKEEIMIYLMVPVISRIDQFRKMARKNLEPFFYLICLSSSMDSLKKETLKTYIRKQTGVKLQT